MTHVTNNLFSINIFDNCTDLFKDNFSLQTDLGQDNPQGTEQTVSTVILNFNSATNEGTLRLLQWSSTVWNTSYITVEFNCMEYMYMFKETPQ